MEKKIESRLQEVAEAIVELVGKKDSFESFEIAPGVFVINGKELNESAEDDGRELVGEDTLHISSGEGKLEMYVDAEDIAKIMQEQEDPEEAFWLIHPKDKTVVLVTNRGQEHEFCMSGSFYANPSAEQDYEAELESFLDFLENEEMLSIDYFPIVEENGKNMFGCGLTLTHKSGTPANVLEPEDCELEWLNFVNSDPYNAGELKVYEYLEGLMAEIEEMDEETVARIKKFYPYEIKRNA